MTPAANKPREWWIDSVSDTLDNCFDAFVYNKDPLVFTEIHVVEHSAYAKAIAALKVYSNKEGSGHMTHYWAEHVLRELGEIE